MLTMAMTEDAVFGGMYNHRLVKLRDEMTEKVECYYDYCQSDTRLVEHFFRCSLLGRWDCFDFDCALDCVINDIRQKLTEHGFCEFEDFVGNQEDFYSKEPLLEYVVDRNIWWSVDIDELFEAVMQVHYNALQREFGTDEVFLELSELVDRYESGKWEYDESEAISLFDACIHAEHHNGWVLEEVDDPDHIRESVEHELAD